MQIIGYDLIDAEKAERDYRKKIQMKIEINGKENKKPIIVEKQLITKSRAEYGKKQTK